MTTWERGSRGGRSTDPPPEGCPLCGSTWGDLWQEVQGRSEFFCCQMCADQWVTMIEKVREGTGWPRVDSIDIEGNRWGRTCEAHHEGASYRFFVVFTPEGDLRRFDPLEPLPVLPAGTEEPGAEETEPAETEAEEPAPTTEGAEVQGEALESPEGEVEAPEVGAAAPAESELPAAIRDQIAHESRDFPSLLEIPVDEARQVVRKISRETDDLAGEPAAVGMLKTSSFALPDHRVPVRVYLPTNGDEPFPVVVYFHGGGWVFGDLDTHDSLCREIAQRSWCAVVSVAYRRSPEHKYPAAIDDAYAAVQWVADPATAARLQIDPERIAVAGDSVGGNLAAVVCLIAR